jgi:hypothetical protein
MGRRGQRLKSAAHGQRFAIAARPAAGMMPILTEIGGEVVNDGCPRRRGETELSRKLA